MPSPAGQEGLRHTFQHMVPAAFYAACALCAVGVAMLIRSARGAGWHTGTLLALLGLAGMISLAGKRTDGAIDWSVLCLAAAGFMAVWGATRVLGHPRPVIAALCFVLVILAGMVSYIILDAPFLAFALVIVYAGAILITYLFVLMLASQQPGGAAEEYDRTPRDPVSAILVGTVLLAALATAVFSVTDPGKGDAEVAAALANRRQWLELNSLPRLLSAEVAVAAPGAQPIREGPTPPVAMRQGEPTVAVRLSDGTQGRIHLTDRALPSNVQSVGLALVTDFPASLELAGVVLLMALLGSVILARRQTELADEERSTQVSKAPGSPR